MSDDSIVDVNVALHDYTSIARRLFCIPALGDYQLSLRVRIHGNYE